MVKFIKVSGSGELPSGVGLIPYDKSRNIFLQVHRTTVEHLIAQGALQAIHVGRRLRITRHS